MMLTTLLDRADVLLDELNQIQKGFQMGTLDAALKAQDSDAFNPPYKEPTRTQAMADEIEDCLDILRSRGKLITSVIYDGDDCSLNCKEANELGDILARVMDSTKHDLSEAVEDLRKLFERPLYKQAEEMAEELIDA